MVENSEILERFLPGYRIVCRLFARYLHIDLTEIMTVLFVIFALFKSVEYLWNTASRVLLPWLTSSIVISSELEIYKDVLRWVSENVIDHASGLWMGARTLAVAEGHESDSDALTNGMKVDTAPLRYEPALASTTWFFRGGNLICVRRQKAMVRDKSLTGDELLLTALGITAEPLKGFLEECRRHRPRFPPSNVSKKLD